MHNPPDLATAMSLSKLYEHKEQPICSQVLDACKSKRTDFSPQHVIFLTKLTRSEMEERRLKGLCFNCDEPFTRGHQCKKLFWIDSIYDDVEFFGKGGVLILSTLSAWGQARSKDGSNVSTLLVYQ